MGLFNIAGLWKLNPEFDYFVSFKESILCFCFLNVVNISQVNTFLKNIISHKNASPFLTLYGSSIPHSLLVRINNSSSVAILPKCSQIPSKKVSEGRDFRLDDSSVSPGVKDPCFPGPAVDCLLRGGPSLTLPFCCQGRQSRMLFKMCWNKIEMAPKK